MEAYSFTVTVMGSSASTLSKGRHNSSFLIERNGEYMLLDAPSTLPKVLTEFQIPIEKVKGAVITHDHIDHSLGLPALIHNFLHQKKILPVYAPAQTVETLRQVLEVFRLSREDRSFKTIFHPIEVKPGIHICNFNGLEFTAHPTLHTRETMAVSVADKKQGKKVVFTSDTGYLPEMAAFALGADLLVHDCSGLYKYASQIGKYHSSCRQAAQSAAVAGVKHLLLTHLNQEYFPDEDALVEEGAEVFTGKISVAAENDVYRF